MRKFEAKTILFDLDGTITNPAKGIIASYKFALDQFGVTLPPEDNLFWVIGPPLRACFPKLLGSDENVEAAVGYFRDYYSETGIFQASVYGGIPEALFELRDAGYKLHICTAKPQIFAKRVIEHFNLSEFFSGIYGVELDGRFDNKADLINHILKKENIRPADTLMIGDHGNDILAAQANNMDALGVLWGYGSQSEFSEAGCNKFVNHPLEIPSAVNL